jgi:hypothetical protein
MGNNDQPGRRARRTASGNKMKLSDFVAHLPDTAKKGAREDTLQIWFCIYSHISTHGQADRYDESLQSAISSAVRYISDSNLQRQLKRMADLGLIAGHRTIARYTALGKAMLPFGGLFFDNSNHPAGAFTTYTLPGMAPVYSNAEDADAEEAARPRR